MHFDWDPRKAKSNMRKHALSFEEAATVSMIPFRLLLMTLIIQTMNAGSLQSAILP